MKNNKTNKTHLGFHDIQLTCLTETELRNPKGRDGFVGFP